MDTEGDFAYLAICLQRMWRRDIVPLAHVDEVPQNQVY